MALTRRIFVSMPADRWLTTSQNNLKWGIVERIEQLGYTPEIFTDPTGRTSLAASRTWSADLADEIVRRCQGAVLIGLPRWRFPSENGPALLSTEYSHYEGALARAFGLPLLVLRQANLRQRVVFDDDFGSYVGEFPERANKSWLKTTKFQVPFGYWREMLELRRDVFLAYSGASAGPAENLKGFLQNDIGATVLDWQRDFRPGRSILEEIEEARQRCTAGIFLFMKDDELAKPSLGREAAPRDNVVFEAGYFISAKGKPRVLIIREGGAKMPADLGGDIYASLEDRTNLAPVEETVRQFLTNL